MLPKGVSFVGRTPGQVLLKLKLLTQFFTGLYLLCLVSLFLPNPMSCCQNLRRTLSGREQYTVCIGKDNIFSRNFEITKSKSLILRHQFLPNPCNFSRKQVKILLPAAVVCYGNAQTVAALQCGIGGRGNSLLMNLHQNLFI